MNTFFLDLFRYNHEANQLLIKAIAENQSVATDRCIRLMSHVLNVHQIWNAKVLTDEKSIDPWMVHSIVDFEAINKENFEDTIKILSEFDLNETIKYSTRSGREFTNTGHEILFQAINHSTYHRGQIATEFRNMGVEPKMTDYILFRMKPAI